MAKGDSYYITHDVDSFCDDKIIRLRMRFGIEGYGLYWAILEMMFSAPEHRLPADAEGLLAIGYQTRTSLDMQEFMDKCYELGLFEKDDGQFWSNSFIRRMAIAKSFSEEQAEKGRKSAEARRKRSESGQDGTVDQPPLYQSSGTVQPRFNHGSTAAQPINDSGSTSVQSITEIGSTTVQPRLNPELNRTELNRTELNRTEPAAAASAREAIDLPGTIKTGITEVAEALTDLLGRLPSASEGRLLMAWLQEDGLDPGLVLACVEAAAMNNARNIGYVKTVLSSAVEYGCRTAADFKKREAVFQASKKKQATARSGTLKAIPTEEDYLAGSDLDEADLFMYAALAEEAEAKGDREAAKKYLELLGETEQRVGRAKGNGTSEQHVWMA